MDKQRHLSARRLFLKRRIMMLSATTKTSLSWKQQRLKQLVLCKLRNKWVCRRKKWRVHRSLDLVQIRKLEMLLEILDFQILSLRKKNTWRIFKVLLSSQASPLHHGKILWMKFQVNSKYGSNRQKVNALLSKKKT